LSVSTPRRRGAWGLPGCLSGIAGMCDLTTPGPERSLGDSSHNPQHDAVETASLGASKLMGFVRIATHSVVSSHSSCALCWSHPRGGLGCTPPPLPSTPPIPRASHAGSAPSTSNTGWAVLYRPLCLSHPPFVPVLPRLCSLTNAAAPPSCHSNERHCTPHVNARPHHPPTRSGLPWAVRARAHEQQHRAQHPISSQKWCRPRARFPGSTACICKLSGLCVLLSMVRWTGHWMQQRPGASWP